MSFPCQSCFLLIYSAHKNCDVARLELRELISNQLKIRTKNSHHPKDVDVVANSLDPWEQSDLGLHCLLCLNGPNNYSFYSNSCIIFFISVSISCTAIHRYPIFSMRYSVMFKVYTGYHGTNEIYHGLCTCTVIIPSLKLGIIPPYRCTNHTLSFTCFDTSSCTMALMRDHSIFILRFLQEKKYVL